MLNRHCRILLEKPVLSLSGGNIGHNLNFFILRFFWIFQNANISNEHFLSVIILGRCKNCTYPKVLLKLAEQLGRFVPLVGNGYLSILINTGR